ncbi:MAG: AraC family transcriptional regulator, partial [Lachnospiraceae bacterium]|nr:AraC family transcriptional regulator [Lachnospiraceae bacterium]
RRLAVLKRNTGRRPAQIAYSEPGTSSFWSYMMFNPWGFFKGILPITNRDYNLNTLPLETFRFILRQSAYPEVLRLSLAAIKELKEKKYGYEVSAKGLLLALYMEIYRAEDGDSLKDDPVRSPPDFRSEKQSQAPSPDNRLVIAPALDYIFQNYMQQFTINDLAELCHMSDTHFRRTFREIMNTSPLDYLHNTRITRACTLLGSTQKSILEISEQVGYRTLSSFNRHFQQVMQTTPREYRRNIMQQEKTSQATAILEYSGWIKPQV